MTFWDVWEIRRGPSGEYPSWKFLFTFGGEVIGWKVFVEGIIFKQRSAALSCRQCRGREFRQDWVVYFDRQELRVVSSTLSNAHVPRKRVVGRTNRAVTIGIFMWIPRKRMLYSLDRHRNCSRSLHKTATNRPSIASSLESFLRSDLCWRALRDVRRSFAWVRASMN